MIKITFLFLFFYVTILLGQTNIEFIGSINQYHSVGYNDIWGYVDSIGNEYAPLGVRNETAIIDLSDPAKPVEDEFIPGTNPPWRYFNVEPISNLDEHNSADRLRGYNDIWGYVDGQGIEYALMGTRGGTSIIRLDDPVNPQEVAFIPRFGGARDIKVHGQYAYTISFDVDDQGFKDCR